MILLYSISCSDINNSVDGDVVSVAASAAYASGNYDNDFLPEDLTKETRDMKKDLGNLSYSWFAGCSFSCCCCFLGLAFELTVCPCPAAVVCPLSCWAVVLLSVMLVSSVDDADDVDDIIKIKKLSTLFILIIFWLLLWRI